MCFSSVISGTLGIILNLSVKCRDGFDTLIDHAPEKLHFVKQVTQLTKTSPWMLIKKLSAVPGQVCERAPCLPGVAGHLLGIRLFWRRSTYSSHRLPRGAPHHVSMVPPWWWCSWNFGNFWKFLIFRVILSHCTCTSWSQYPQRRKWKTWTLHSGSLPPARSRGPEGP